VSKSSNVPKIVHAKDDMEIKISRHAKRRMSLYRIDESDVIETIKREMTSMITMSETRTAVNRDLSSKYGFPLKVVFVHEGHTVIVVSAYPVKKEREK